MTGSLRHMGNRYLPFVERCAAKKLSPKKSSRFDDDWPMFITWLMIVTVMA
jgi:hypothetical protein